MMMLEKALILLAKHWALVELVIDAVENHGVDPARARQLIEDEMTDRANARMREELGR